MIKNLIEKITGVAKLKAEKLYWAIGYALTSAIYVKDSLGRGSTYCNVMAYDLLDSNCKVVWHNDIRVGESEKIRLPMGNVISAYDYDIHPIMPNHSYDDILNAPIPDVYNNCIIQQGKGTRLIQPEYAQRLANHGIPTMIISKKFNHVAITCPDLHWDIDKGRMVFLPYDPKKGVFTGNAGEVNDYMYMSDSRGFGYVDWKSSSIIYVQLKPYGKGFESIK